MTDQTLFRIFHIDNAVRSLFAITAHELRGASRDRRVCYPRQAAMALARQRTRLSLPAIGQWYGRDHTTVLHAVRSVAGDPDRRGAMMLAIESEVLAQCGAAQSIGEGLVGFGRQ